MIIHQLNNGLAKALQQASEANVEVSGVCDIFQQSFTRKVQYGNRHRTKLCGSKNCDTENRRRYQQNRRKKP